MIIIYRPNSDYLKNSWFVVQSIFIKWKSWIAHHDWWPLFVAMGTNCTRTVGAIHAIVAIHCVWNDMGTNKICSWWSSRERWRWQEESKRSQEESERWQICGVDKLPAEKVQENVSKFIFLCVCRSVVIINTILKNCLRFFWGNFDSCVWVHVRILSPTFLS